jgi:uroporphyrinogen-III synthase
MGMRILVTRPREDGEQIAAKLAALGHTALLAPLLEPRFHDGPEPALNDVQAILATSANGIRALIRRTARRDIPIFAVGPQTTEEARAAGFSDVRCMSAAKTRPAPWSKILRDAASSRAARCFTESRR